MDREKGRSITSKLHMTAANTSVVQCWEHNHSAVRPSEKNNYSKFALLRVLKSEGIYVKGYGYNYDVSYVRSCNSYLANIHGFIVSMISAGSGK